MSFRRAAGYGALIRQSAEAMAAPQIITVQPASRAEHTPVSQLEALGLYRTIRELLRAPA
jgi:hypothetical protein